MGYDLHVTKAEHWTEAEQSPIEMSAWLSLVASDPELAVSPHASYDREVEEKVERANAVLWRGHPEEEVPLWFEAGEITAKNPDDATIVKLLEIAHGLQARVIGDDGEVYRRSGSPPGWEAV